MSFSMDDIKELRHKTGIGIGECKKALTETNGDVEAAVANLRKKGLASAVKKQGREAKEGTIGISSTDQTLAIVEINSETDFVVKNERFQEFVKNIADAIAKTKPESLESFLSSPYPQDPSLSVEEYRATIVQAIGENIQIKRLKLFDKTADNSLGAYSHLGGKIVTVIQIEGSPEEEVLAKSIAMHTAAAYPEYLKPEEIPQEVIQNEREIAKEQVKGKPENIIEKIIDGKIRAFYDQVCLTHQYFIRDDKVRISELVANQSKATNKPLALTHFTYWKVGE